jgi:GLPGLI family protein
MIKILFKLFICIFFVSNVVAQKQGKIRYTSKTPNGTKILDMWFTNEAYLYEYRYEDPTKTAMYFQLKSKPDFDSTEFVNQILQQQKNQPHPNVYGSSKNSIQIQTLLSETKKVCVVDTLPVMEWTLLPDTTTIKQIFCRKATCKFNYKTYYAWYAPSIPISLAPLSFQGLPGLLISISDVSSDEVISMQDLEWPTKKPIVIEPCSGVALISKKEFLSRQRGRMEMFKKMLEEKKEKTITDVLDKVNKKN